MKRANYSLVLLIALLLISIASPLQALSKFSLQTELSKRWSDFEVPDLSQSDIMHLGLRAHIQFFENLPMNIGAHFIQAQPLKSDANFSQSQFGVESQFWLKHDLFSLYPIASIGYGKEKTQLEDSLVRKFSGEYILLSVGLKWQSPLDYLSVMVNYEFQQTFCDEQSKPAGLDNYQSIYSSHKTSTGLSFAW